MSMSISDSRRTSIQSEIKSILKKNAVGNKCTHGILIGSRGARHHLPNFRGMRQDQHADWNILSSASFFLAWWDEHHKYLQNLTLSIPKSKDGHKLDLYVDCTMHDESNHRFIIPQSSLSYSAFILDHSTDWIVKQSSCEKLIRKGNGLAIASTKLLLILKKYFLYYSHSQWRKTANDYRELLTIAEPFAEEDGILCDLVLQFNERIHGKRLIDDCQSVINDREEFFQQKKSKRTELIYQIARSKSNADDILTGLEYLCTKAPLWFVDYVTEQWISIQNEKFNEKSSVIYPYMKLNVDHPCLFPLLSNNTTQRILHHLTDIADFYTMQFVCKQWYTLFHQESFWKDLYVSQYGTHAVVSDWKMLYFIRMLRPFTDESNQLVDSSVYLRRVTGNDVLQLWEDLTHQTQRINARLRSRMDIILSNAFYYQMDESLNQFSVKLIVDGLKDGCAPSKLDLAVRMSEYRTSHFMDHIEELIIEFQSKEQSTYSMKFLGPNLMGFDLDRLGYIATESILFTTTPSCIFPDFPLGLLICLFIMMIHPIHRTHFIQYLKNLESHCLKNLID